MESSIECYHVFFKLYARPVTRYLEIMIYVNPQITMLLFRFSLTEIYKDCRSGYNIRDNVVFNCLFILILCIACLDMFKHI